MSLFWRFVGFVKGIFTPEVVEAAAVVALREVLRERLTGSNRETALRMLEAVAAGNTDDAKRAALLRLQEFLVRKTSEGQFTQIGRVLDLLDEVRAQLSL